MTKEKKAGLCAALFLLLAFFGLRAEAYCGLGDYGDEVLMIQQHLNLVGYEVEENAVYDEAMVETIADYQRRHLLDVTGRMDEKTFVWMFGKEFSGMGDVYVGNGREWFPARVLDHARQYLGVPYVWGGDTPEGFDCSGYVQYVFALAGCKLPRTADLQFNYGYIIEQDQLLPGDLVFFETYEPGPSHVGIYYAKGYFIHADSVTGMINIDTIEREYRQGTYLGARRMYLW